MKDVASLDTGPVDIELYVWPLDVAAHERERLAALLSDDERARAARFVFERDRHRFIAGRGKLREILAGRLSRDPASLRFSYSAHDKPALAGAPALHFNLSHAQGLGAAVLSQEFPLGVDIEHIRPLKEDIAGRYFSQAEVAALAKLSADEQLIGFYRCWTRKEAIVKAIGEGLSRPLDSFDVSVDARVPPVLERLEGEEKAAQVWRLAHFEPAVDFVGAIACRTGGAPLRIRRTDLL